MPGMTATSLASHAHFQCDLYIHQAYHGVSSEPLTPGRPAHPKPTAAVHQAVLTSGDTWESILFSHLDQHGLLLTIKGPPLTGADIASVVELEERSHFFIAGIAFWPPRQRFSEEYEKRGVAVENIPNWGLAKPDLIEIWSEGNGCYVWRIIDAKASKDVKTSHLVQTYFYHLCLTYILPSSFLPAPTVAIWLSTEDLLRADLTVSSLSLTSLHSTAIAPLVVPLSELLFKRLPTILSRVRQDVPWHFNPLCRSCPFSSSCRARVQIEGGLGKAGELTVKEAADVRGFMKLSKTMAASRDNEGDIEDISPAISAGKQEETSELAQLAALLEDDRLLKLMEQKWPANVKRVWRILGIQPRSKTASQNHLGVRSPVLDAALTNIPQFTNRRIYTLPAAEDISIFISLILDPSRSASKISEFCISTEVASSFQAVAQKFGFRSPRHIHGNVDSFVSELARCIHNVLGLHDRILSGSRPRPSGDNRHDEERAREHDPNDPRNLPRTQVYVWSIQERDAIQKHLIAVALCSDVSQTTGSVNADDIRICIGALCEGASLLATTFQPHVLEGALLGFLKKQGKNMDELAAVMGRLGIPFTGEQTAEAMRQRIVAEIERLGSGRAPHRNRERRTVGILPRVVVLKNELRRLVAIPVPGWWDVKEAALVFGVASANRCPDEPEIFRRYWDREDVGLRKALEGRNDACRGLICELRHRARLSGKRELLVNTARVLSAEWVDVCRVEVLRKLFYMQQFEVLLKLQELWDSRIEACPEGPLLVYLGMSTSAPSGSKADESRGDASVSYRYTFELIGGNLEVAPERDRDRAFFDYILVEEHDKNEESLDGDNRNHTDTSSNHPPLEALFDDLCVSGLVFPLNRYTRSRWEEGQPREVKDGRLWVADIQDVKLGGGRTEVILRVWSGQNSRKALRLGKKYRLSPRLVDFNTNKVLSTLVELDLQVDSDTPSRIQASLPPFAQLITNPKSFGNQGYLATISTIEEQNKKALLEKEASLHRLYTELHNLGNENAGALILKASQRKATQRIISERLTVIWGPPGSGKSYTIALSLLRMLEVQAATESIAPLQRQIIFLTAMTHAAIHACLSKLHKLIGRYRSIPDLSLKWLNGLRVEHVLSGSTHQKPADIKARGQVRESNYDAAETNTWIYAGTVFQLYTFGKRLGQEANCVVIDEAGQLGLGAASLVLRSLSQEGGLWRGKVVVAGDREQLAPIFAGKYPDLVDGQRLFGSVLDCLMGKDEWEETVSGSTGVTTPENASVGTVVQLLENFRLNPDLGNFVQTIYKRAFKPQKEQAKQVATQLRQLEDETSWDEVSESSRKLLLALSSAMLGKKQILFQPPRKKDAKATEPVLDVHGYHSDITLTPRAISLAMVRLRVRGDPLGEMAYESHVRAEAKVAAALVQLLGKVHGWGAEEREDDTFVACPHRAQRAAVKEELDKLEKNRQAEGCLGEDEDEELERLIREMQIDGEEKPEVVSSKIGSTKDSNRSVVIDTIERLQGSEASFVICLFSHTHRGSVSTALPFLLARRRLNVAISRAKTLCIVIASDEVLQPDVGVFADRENARGYAFLRAFEERAWSAEIEVDLEDCQ